MNAVILPFKNLLRMCNLVIRQIITEYCSGRGNNIEMQKIKANKQKTQTNNNKNHHQVPALVATEHGCINTVWSMRNGTGNNGSAFSEGCGEDKPCAKSGRVFQAESTEGTMATGQECAWNTQKETARRLV